MPTTAIMLRVRVLTVCYLGNPELIIHNLEHGHCPTHTRQLTTAHTAAEVTFLPAPATTPATRRNVAELWTLTRGVINILRFVKIQRSWVFTLLQKLEY